jgi:hypothetical protein
MVATAVIELKMRVGPSSTNSVPVPSCYVCVCVCTLYLSRPTGFLEEILIEPHRSRPAQYAAQYVHDRRDYNNIVHVK